MPALPRTYYGIPPPVAETDDGMDPESIAIRAALSGMVPSYAELNPGTFKYVMYPQEAFDEVNRATTPFGTTRKENLFGIENKKRSVPVYTAPPNVVDKTVGFTSGRDVFATPYRSHAIIQEALDAGNQVLEGTLPEKPIRASVAYHALDQPEVVISPRQATKTFK